MSRKTLNRKQKPGRLRQGTKTDWKTVMPPVVVGAVILTVFSSIFLLSPRAPEVDERGCPKTGEVGATVLLLDTSDPLTAKHEAELRRLAQQFVDDQTGRLRIEPEELLVVYEITQDPSEPTQVYEKCRPQKHPNERTWLDDVHQGRRYADRDWNSFEEALLEGFGVSQKTSLSISPILETMSVLAAKHFPGKRVDAQFDAHFIVFSDLLQHTYTDKGLSHYESYPEATDVHRNLLTDLTNTNVSLFRLERPEYATWQTDHHYYWWTEIILKQGGSIVWQDSF